ncbi:GGDEF domain-containing protein [Roseibacterium sp. SDUM158017]|uniref:GGDEF domain-containing protein n=1 Tax=Roseicyclus salinarum TaxID=3036773 RepID=UPI002414F8B1|nr:GGDEF domain-containing protein [Roseibacterium sp. SDUM158017]MDG4648603.1 GGDEF domain-containing protein [Roseibacterium sp. SDUM158017]
MAAGGEGTPGSDDPVLDRLLPMHLRFGANGIVRHVAPTLAKMCGGQSQAGRALFDVIEIRAPVAETVADLMALDGQRLTLALRAAPDLPLRGVVAGRRGCGDVLLDISLGLCFQRAVTRFGLTMSDFSPCDQTVELLYLQEANAAIGRLSRQLTERLSAARAAAERQALTDPLTGLANRRAMDRELARLLQDPAECLTLVQIDLDHFKQVNDTHGHAAGDRVLEAVAAILAAEIRGCDMAARMGGDEFLVLLRDTTDREALGAVADRLIRRIEHPLAQEGRRFGVSASIGIATTAAYGTRPSADRLLADTDAALYRAKRAGRGRYVLHRPARPEPRLQARGT